MPSTGELPPPAPKRLPSIEEELGSPIEHGGIVTVEGESEPPELIGELPGGSCPPEPSEIVRVRCVGHGCDLLTHLDERQ